MLLSVTGQRHTTITRWLIMFGLIAPINLLMSLDRQAMTLSAPRIQEQFGFSLIQMSTIVACVLWTYALLQIPAGALVNHFGPRRTLFLACLAWSVATIMTPFAGSFMGFLAIRLAMGAGQSPDWSSSIVTIDNWFRRGERARANSILLAFLYLGSVIGGPLTTSITTMWSWKVSFFIYGIAGIGWGLLWVFFVRDHPPVGERPDGIIKQRPRVTRRQVQRFLRSWQFWSIGLHYMCLLTVQSFFLVIMPFYLMNGRHISYGSMGWLYGLPWLFLYVSVFVSGMIADHVQKRTASAWWARTPAGIAGTLLSGLLVGAGSMVHDDTAMILVFCLSLGFTGLSQISIWTSVQDLTTNYTGIVAGWTTFWGNAASGVAPIVMVYIEKETGSWPMALCLPVVAGIIGAVCCIGTHPELPIEME
ncbi:Hexuronate transporter [Gluconacetobacter sp. SXCC-1]|uniref:MFS transporter n=1 Tax=Komagataeibacter rhaeticus TaxID=215221 RepID=A0A181C5Q8_9PROT|nr:MFS transporter [Komagataeibacter rhaeticus]ATU72724.1 MFS transporter [Komagataeibacter xylinus]EGG76597.1 Hexuronate transporter [Gluconacetobacter sp. SXCC-1]QIP36553.1 MFS transporter [Komagataeibacter rhaeticus]QOC46325.1 MFS transporter [Komagataeibacter rhaeticus]WPP22495.1 MFS transporter [Komagataeibacter rhaeticus]